MKIIFHSPGSAVEISSGTGLILAQRGRDYKGVLGKREVLSACGKRLHTGELYGMLLTVSWNMFSLIIPEPLVCVICLQQIERCWYLYTQGDLFRSLTKVV